MIIFSSRAHDRKEITLDIFNIPPPLKMDVTVQLAGGVTSDTKSSHKYKSPNNMSIAILLDQEVTFG